MRQSRPRTKREPTIALINIVFLMLVFFMVAGTLSQPLDTDLRLISTSDLEGRAPPDALVIRPDGTLIYRGTEITSAASFLPRREDEPEPDVRLVPDRDLPAADLVRIARDLRRAGAGAVIIVTERELQ
ncbi:biopolymer transporter ExbD [Roseovarius sp. LXJ103]|uniref:ExbD/TolR family protein n=1 Tax=Roseovarius carneus TaxID=2853164 RepID=UPI000D60F1C3|nr:biopolymer transporter ExbD [Roseovarius carneus]MBZ8119760.1 biopolymer transporter ExbD [Roseovarius carneus]PWE34636.1 biopolymer transporter ExbD [Pelagicola sp. LXJ1103]